MYLYKWIPQETISFTDLQEYPRAIDLNIDAAFGRSDDKLCF